MIPIVMLRDSTIAQGAEGGRDNAHRGQEDLRHRSGSEGVEHDERDSDHGETPRTSGILLFTDGHPPFERDLQIYIASKLEESCHAACILARSTNSGSSLDNNSAILTKLDNGWWMQATKDGE
eukprot:5228498-Pyramimonas_sp.AAC.1